MHILACVSTCCALCSVEMRLSMPDGTVVTNDASLVQLADGTLRFKMAAADVPSVAVWLEVLPAFMTARAGKPGFWVLPDGRYGTFRNVEIAGIDPFDGCDFAQKSARFGKIADRRHGRTYEGEIK